MAYSVVVYALDVSPSMVGMTADPSGEGKRAKIDLAKEYIARMCEPKIQSGRKTEHVGLVSFGGRTNNQANRSWISDNPNDDDPPYMAISSEVAIQSAKPKILEALMNLEVGEDEGNPVSAIMVALDMIEQHKHTKRWAIEIRLVTDGESSFVQEEYEEAMKRLDSLGIKLTVIGIDFQDPELPVEKDKSKAKRLSEKFWRAFVKTLHEDMSRTTESDFFLPQLLVFTPQLEEARRPHPATTEGTVSSIHLYIGAAGIDDDQAIAIPMQYSKATMKARPPSLSKAWKTAVDMQQPARGTQASQMLSQISESQHTPVQAEPAEVANMISGKVNRHSTYFIKHKPEGAAASTQLSATQRTNFEDDEDFLAPPRATQAQTQTQETPAEEEEGEEEPVEKEDLVRAWRFGSSLIPVEADTFEPLLTQKGVEVLGFIPQANVRKYMLIGDVRYLWPDLTSPKAQIQFSSFVSALYTTELVAITRFVAKDGAEPQIGVAIPKMEFLGDDKRLDLMYWIRLPFADDEHKFWFPSLTKYHSTTGKEITEHPYIPTEEQCDLMDQLVKEMDLDTVPPPGSGSKPKHEEESDAGSDEEMDDTEGQTWFNSALSVNPVIHRIKEAILHASLTADPEADPLGPPHPEITQYFHTPEEIAVRVEKITEQLKDALDIKKVPPRARRAANKGEALRDDEGYLDIDELFGAPAPSVQTTQIKDEPVSPAKPKRETQEDVKPKLEEDPDFILPSPTKAKPKPGRLISNERPLEDYNRLVQGEGDMFKKAIQDLSAVVKENVAASFSHSAFPLAIKCLEAMRSTALTFEEVETYNDAIDDLEKTVKAPEFKHKDFWKHFEKAGAKVARITPEEAEAALEEEDYE